jgi:hypothetical protein
VPEYNTGMSRYCVRCTQELHKGQEHLCPDIAKRLKRREAQVEAVCKLLYTMPVPEPRIRQAAEAIVAKLSQMGVEND